MTTQEIIKGLRLCQGGRACNWHECPLGGEHRCMAELKKQAADAIEELQERIDIMMECRDWVDCKNAMPVSGQPVMATVDDNGQRFVVLAYRINDEWRSVVTGGTFHDKVVYWMPLAKAKED